MVRFLNSLGFFTEANEDNEEARAVYSFVPFVRFRLEFSWLMFLPQFLLCAFCFSPSSVKSVVSLSSTAGCGLKVFVEF